MKVEQQVPIAMAIGVIGIAVLVGALGSSKSPPTPRALVSATASQPATIPAPRTEVPDEPEESVSTPSEVVAPGEDMTRPPVEGREATSLALLDQIRVEPRTNPTGRYEREAFGSSWSDTDGNGCNQRDDVLLRDAEPGSVRTAWQGRCGHDVLAGTWVDPYTGRTLVLTDMKDRRQSMAVQIDHVVPLSEAWVSGADAWTDDQRHRFANDVNGLLAVDGPTNQSKSDGDPAAWRPRKGYQCAYAERWIAVKYRWRLAADPSEVRALKEMLNYC